MLGHVLDTHFVLFPCVRWQHRHVRQRVLGEKKKDTLDKLPHNFYWLLSVPLNDLSRIGSFLQNYHFENSIV